MPNYTALAIGLVAGIAAGAATLFGASGMLFPLMLAAPAGVYIASLGWGGLPGAIAAIAATITVTLGSNVTGGVIFAALSYAPAAWAGYLVNLARPSPDGSGLVWYPLSGILLRLMLALFAGCIVTGVAMGFDRAEAARWLSEFFDAIYRANPDLPPPDEAALKATAQLYVSIFPLLFPAAWLLIHVLVMQISVMITSRIGSLARPREDIAANINLPAEALLFPVGGIAAMTLLNSPGYEIGAVATGLGISGFALLGLAGLHLGLRGRASRGPILFANYLLLAIFTLPLLVFAVFGAWRALRRRSTGPDDGGNLPKTE